MLVLVELRTFIAYIMRTLDLVPHKPTTPLIDWHNRDPIEKNFLYVLSAEILNSLMQG